MASVLYGTCGARAFWTLARNAWACVLRAALEATGGETELHRLLKIVPTTSFFATVFMYKSRRTSQTNQLLPPNFVTNYKVAHGWHVCQPPEHAFYPTDVTTRVEEAGLSDAYHNLPTLLGPQDFLNLWTCTSSQKVLCCRGTHES